MKLDTVAVHAGASPDPSTGAVAPPIHLSTNFARTPDGVPMGGHVYTRESNPTQDRVEEALAAVEGGAAALHFGSGMAAATALLQSLPPGGRVVLPDDVYHGVRVLGLEFLPRWGITPVFAAMDDLACLEQALAGGASLLWVETPSNPLMKVVDLAPAIRLGREAGAVVAVDNTFATPVLQRPLDLGADVVLHATTKYFGGHSDVLGGALVFARRDGLFERTSHVRHVTGGVASPFSSWLVLRGIRSLACRVRAQSETALALARLLDAHPAVSAVHYPGLPADPGHEVAARQMSAFGAMLSLRVRGGEAAALAVVSRVRLFVRATSLGGVESLIEHRASSEGEASRTPRDLLRISVGLEHVDDLAEDLSRALSGTG